MDTINIKSDKSKGWIFTIKAHNGLEIIIDAAKSATVSYVKEKTCEYLNFLHPHYFGIQYFYQKLKFVGWLPEKKELKKEIEKNDRSVQLAYKFYDPQPESIPCEVLRHALYIQLRKDIVDGRLTQNEGILARLAALCLLIELGEVKDNAEFKRNLFSYTFVPAKMNLLIEPDSDFYIDVHEAYREYRGKDISWAELEFLKICGSLPFYGIHRFELLDANKSPTNIGIGRDGVYLLEDDIIQNIILWKAIKSIIIKNNDVSIHLVNKDAFTCRSKNDNVIARYGLGENTFYDIYGLFPTNIAVFKSLTTQYSQNFYALLVESYNFYQCKEATKPKSPNDAIIAKTLRELRAEYGSTPKNGNGDSILALKRYSTLHLVNDEGGNQETKSRRRNRKKNIDPYVRQSIPIPSTAGETLEDASLHSSKIKDILIRQKNAIKKRVNRKTLLTSPEPPATRSRSRTINDIAKVRFSTGKELSNNANERFPSTSFQHLSNVNIDFNSGVAQTPQLTSNSDMFNATIARRISNTPRIGSSVSKPSQMERECSSDSSVNNFHIETIDNAKRASAISSHLSALSLKDKSEFTLKDGFHISDENRFDKNETEIINNLINYKPSSDQEFNNEQDIVNYINSGKTLDNAKVLGEVITKIKNIGPTSPYKCETTPEDIEITSKWIQSIGTIPQGDVNHHQNRPFDKDFIKGFEIVENKYNMEHESNPLLEAQTLLQSDENTTTDNTAL